MQRAVSNHPSPVLSIAEVRDVLVERNATLGAVGGAVGGTAGAGAPGAIGGALGGRLGGRIAGRLVNVKGMTRTLQVPWSFEAIERARSIMAPIEAARASDRVVVGILGAGALDANGAVVQLVWQSDSVEVTAHGLEGLVDQRTAADAIGKVEAALSMP